MDHTLTLLTRVYLLLTTYYLLLATYYLLLTTYYLLLTTYYLLLTTHYSLLTTLYLLLTIRLPLATYRSPLTACHLLLARASRTCGACCRYSSSPMTRCRCSCDSRYRCCRSDYLSVCLLLALSSLVSDMARQTSC